MPQLATHETPSIVNVFGFGAEITRLCLVKAVTIRQEPLSSSSSSSQAESHFAVYIQIVNRAIQLLCKANQFTEAVLICERCDELRRSVPAKFTVDVSFA